MEVEEGDTIEGQEGGERGGVARALGPTEYGTIKFLRNTRMQRAKGKRAILLLCD